MSPAPLVSICIPTFQGESFLAAALASAARQTYRPLEIVVSDAGSTDGTLAIVQSFAHRSSVDVHVHHYSGQSMGGNWNHCIERASGNYIKLLFQDDLLAADCVEKMMRLAQMDLRIGMVFCRRRVLIDKHNPTHSQWIRHNGQLQNGWCKLESINSGRKLLKTRRLLVPPLNKIGEPTCTLFSRGLFERTGGFDTEMRQALDIAFYYQAMREGYVGFIDEELATFRLHPDQATQRNRTEAVKQQEAALLLKHILSDEVLPYLHWYVRLDLLLNYSPRLQPLGRLSKQIRRGGRKLLGRR